MLQSLHTTSVSFFGAHKMPTMQAAKHMDQLKTQKQQLQLEVQRANQKHQQEVESLQSEHRRLVHDLQSRLSETESCLETMRAATTAGSGVAQGLAGVWTEVHVHV